MNTPEDVRPDELAIALEERGYDSVWFGEHTHIPTDRATPYFVGGELPPSYTRMMDPYSSLMLAASATSHLLVGTAVSLPLEHDVIALAKTIATIDLLSGGRVQLGFGVGWNKEELANHRPISWAQRYRALAECVGALTALWSEDEAEYHGVFYDFDPVWSYPKPAQRPRPTILCGSSGRLGTKNTVEWADAWLPVDASLGNVAKKLGLFRQAALDAGRSHIPITLGVKGNPTFELLAEYRELGVERVEIGVLRDNWEDPTTTYEFLDQYAVMIPDLQ
jgi:probable F420-dependent oxidoreductase